MKGADGTRVKITPPGARGKRAERRAATRAASAIDTSAVVDAQATPPSSVTTIDGNVEVRLFELPTSYAGKAKSSLPQSSLCSGQRERGRRCGSGFRAAFQEEQEEEEEKELKVISFGAKGTVCDSGAAVHRVERR